MKKLGIALGGGGAKGLAHIPMLEVLDELGWKPSMLTGTSIGAIIGALYASGISAMEMRNQINEMTFGEEDSITEVFSKKGVLRWFEYVGLEFKGGGLLKVDNFLSSLSEEVRVSTFEELRIPLKVVASDFWNRSEVVFGSGDLIPAVQASMALPGIFSPVVINDRVLVDGGAVNPVPFDLLFGECEVTVAINVMGKRTESRDRVPSFSDAIFNTFQIMQRSILMQKLERQAPTVYIEPDIVDIRVLEFYKADRVFKQAEGEKRRLKGELEKLLSLP